MVGSLGAIEALPLFPAMKPVEITDRPAVESCTHRLPSSADHNFTTIWIRYTDGRTRLARLGTNLVVEYTDYAGQVATLSFRYAIPASHERRAFPDAGGLMSYGAS